MDLDSVGTGLAILGASELTKDAVQRMLAPTADYIGTGVLSGTKATVNLARVLVAATRKLGPTLDEHGEIPPRVLKAVLDEAPFCEDEVAAEYIGGVLASSWSGQSRDDRGVALMATIRRLSTYALRTHYVCYRTLDSIYREHQDNTFIAGRALHIGMEDYVAAMDFRSGDDPNEALAHAVVSLEREQLATFDVSGGAGEYWSRKDWPNQETTRVGSDALELMRDHGGMTVEPSVLGTELFLWAHGHRSYGYSGEVLDPSMNSMFEAVDMLLPGRATLVRVSLPPTHR